MLEKNVEVCSWEEERQTEILGRLYQGRSEESDVLDRSKWQCKIHTSNPT